MVVTTLALLLGCGGDPGAETTAPGLEWQLEDRTGGGCVTTELPGAETAVHCERATGPLFPAARLVHNVDASAWRGRRLAVRARAWSAPAVERGGVGRIEVTVEGADRVRLFRADDPARGPERSWNIAELVVEIPPQAQRVVVALAAHGVGDYGLAGLTFEVGAPIDLGNVAAAPLEPHQLDHLVTLAAVLGPLRFFATPPTFDFDRLAITAVDQVLAAPDAAGLAVALDVAFGGINGFATSRGGATPPAPATCADGAIRSRYRGPALDVPMAAFAVEVERAAVGGPIPRVAVDLGSGWVAHVPLATCGQPTLPPSSRPAGWAPSPNDRTTRLATVLLAWSALDLFDPERALASGPWRDLLRTTLAEAAGTTDLTPTLERLVSALDDGHAVLGRPVGGRDHRFPFDLTDSRDGVVVSRVAPGSADLAPGDRVLSLDGRPFESVVTEALGQTSASTLAHRRVRAVGNLLHRSAPAMVQLEVAGPGSGPRTVSVSTQPVATAQAALAIAPTRPPFEELGAGVAYLDLRRTPDAAFDELLPRLAAAKKLVVDLRGYPLLSEAKLGHFADHALVGPNFCLDHRSAPGVAEEVCERWQVPPLSHRLSADVVVLIDANTLSYGETLATMFAEHQLGQLVGTPTAGTNGNVTGLWLPAGFRLYWTGMRAAGPDGRSLRGRGVVPDVVVIPSAAAVAAGRDELVEAAAAHKPRRG